MADASSALGAPQVAGAWVTRRGKAKRTMGIVAGAQISGGLMITFGDGSRWELEVARASNSAAEQLIAELGS